MNQAIPGMAIIFFGALFSQLSGSDQRIDRLALSAISLVDTLWVPGIFHVFMKRRTGAAGADKVFAL
ncbi:hypothetical protein [Celeribacter ethanolicus]|uniref:hypothetical protein n=1 Tax=Celeribacter ethanolicus TaxID=1758178 RepID=UPI000835BE48|nr:hypothetical protein [Celeribacter ethanolicus]